MRRLTVFLVLALCASCGRQDVSQQTVIHDAGGSSNQAAIMPRTIGQQLSPTPIFTSRPLPTAGPTSPPRGWNLTKLTNGGCCPGAFWSADSREVYFLARPEPNQPASIYAVPRDGGPAKLVRREPAIFSPDAAYTVTASGEDVIVEGVLAGRRWRITTEGRGVHFSHSMRHVAWTESSDAFTNLNLIQRTIWIADLDQGRSVSVATVVGGGFIGWTRDDAAILVSGGLVTGGPRGVWRVSAGGGEPELLFEAQDVQSPLVSHTGEWLAFFVAFGSDPERNGLWVMRVEDGSAQLLEVFGSYRWRDAGRLLVIPLEIHQPGDGLWQYAALGGDLTELIRPGEMSFKVANNDWSVSPDGGHIAFRSGVDQNIWTLGLPSD